MASNPAYERVDSEPNTPARGPPWWASALLFDVDEAPMLEKRQIVMNVCLTQIVLSFVVSLVNFKRSKVLLILQPFFVGAGLLGYFGARDCKSLFVAAHIMGSAGLALVFLIFLLAETLLKHTGGVGNVHTISKDQANADLFFILINGPMDLFLFSTSIASIVLFLSLRQLRRQLRQRREEIREQFEAFSRGDGPAGRGAEAYPGGMGGVPAGLSGISLSEPGAAAEQRRLYALKQDLRCPITLDVMRDPVLAGDGHSYEREAIERWLAGHRTSPLTGRLMPNTTLLPNHRLRALIQDLQGGSTPRPVQGGPEAGPVVNPRAAAVPQTGPTSWDGAQAAAVDEY